jgi:hypothetical protein
MRLAIPIACAILAACDWGIDAEPEMAVLRFDPPAVSVSVAADTVIRLRNAGMAATGAITLSWDDSTDVAAQGAEYSVTPTSLSGLPPGGEVELGLSIDASGGVPPGSYALRLNASFGGSVTDLPVELNVPGPAPSTAIAAEPVVRRPDEAMAGSQGSR